MIHEHYLAVRDLIPESASYDIHFGSVRPKHDEEGKEIPLRYPYVVVWGDFGTEHSESLARVPDQLDLRPRVTYAGEGYEQVMWLADTVRPHLNRASPVVGGWYAGKMNVSPLRPPEEDQDVTLPGSNTYPWAAVDEFPFTSTRN